LPEVRFWENDIQKFEQLDKSDKYPQDAILFAGSSSIRFWIAVTPTVSRWKVWPEIQKANSLIKQICENQKNIYFIQTDFAFLNENGLPKDELFRDDKLHLTEKGYAVWTEIIKKELNYVLK
jgi:lysophospholipase L1-like esterase